MPPQKRRTPPIWRRFSKPLGWIPYSPIKGFTYTLPEPGRSAYGFSAEFTLGDYLALLRKKYPHLPITGATFILVHTKQADAGKSREVLNFFDWCYKNGDAAAGQLDYVALPASVKDLIRKSWAKVLGPDGKPVYH